MNEVNKNTSPAISVIVPIYNMEKLMRKCLDSILVQTYHDYECLLIDDGSTDGSPVICDEYAAKDCRFKAFHKANGGLSDARNFGLERAQGEYTIFFDPDDWVDETCLEEMCAKALESDADMVICDYFNEDPNRVQYSKQTPTSLNHNDVLRDILTGRLYGFTWNKLLKRSLYQNYGLKYPVGMYGCEDQYTMCKLLKNEISISYIPQAYYHYVVVTSSLSRYYDENTYKNDLLIRKMFVDLLQETSYRDLAFERKTSYMFGRAFMFGYQWFSSKRFVEEFREYEALIFNVPRSLTYNFFYWLSFRGYYRFARSLFGFLFSIKKKLLFISIS